MGCTENKEYSWFLVNFGDNFVIPTHYVIRYQGPDDKTEFKGKKPPKNLFPKCWILQATNDKVWKSFFQI